MLANPPPQVNSLLWSHIFTINDMLSVSLHWWPCHTYCLPGNAFSWETIWGFKKSHTVSSKEKVRGQTSVLLQWVVLTPGFRTTAPKTSSFILSLYHKGLILHCGKLWRHSHAADPSLQISNVADAATVILCLHILLWDRAWEVHIWGDSIAAGPLQPETISSQGDTRAGVEITEMLGVTEQNQKSSWFRNSTSVDASSPCIVPQSSR